MRHPIVHLQDVSRWYDDGRVQAVHKVRLEIYPDEFIALSGSSGSGKSTLLNLMTGIDMPSEGQILFNGVEPKSRKEWTAIRSSQIGFIFQSFNLIPTLTSLENIEVPMFGNGLSPRRRRGRAKEFLERVGLSHRGSHLPNMLSGGERQRVAIARSLVNQPILIAADEPTGNLDTQTAAHIMDLIGDMRRLRNTALILVTHDERLANQADRILRMSDGRIVEKTSGKY